MLSASQGKYDLHKSSGSIGENIKYIYYFTYFYKFEVHPFWDKFEKDFDKKIQSCLDKLQESIFTLQYSRALLRDTLVSIDQNIFNLQHYVNQSGKLAETHVPDLKALIVHQLRSNKDQIQTSSGKIDSAILSTSGELQKHINAKLNEIKKEFESPGKVLSENIAKIKSSLSSFHVRLCKIIVVYNRVSEIHQCKGICKNYDKIIQTLQKYTGKEIKLEVREIQEILKSQVEITKLVKCNTQTYINLVYSGQKLILNYREQTVCISQESSQKIIQMDLSKLIVKQIDRELKDFEGFKNFFIPRGIRDIKGYLKARIQAYSQLQADCKVMKALHEIAKVGLKQADVEKLTKCLRSILEAIQRLKGEAGKPLNFPPVDCPNGKSPDSLEQFVNKLKSVDSHVNSFEEHFKEFEKLKKEFEEQFKKLETFEGDKLKELENSRILKTCRVIKTYIKDLISDKKSIEEHLQKIEEQLKKLHHLITAILHLNCIKQSVEHLRGDTSKTARWYPGPSKDKPLGKLATEQDQLVFGARKLECMGDTLTELSYTLTRDITFGDFPQIMHKILSYYQTVETHNKALESHISAVTLKILRGADKEKVLDNISRKMTGISRSLTVVTNNLAEYLKPEKSDKGDIEAIKTTEIRSMKENIKAITEADKKIKEEYKHYTDSFAAFKEALKDLEKCLDFIIRDFLACSLCTTVCNYNHLQPLTGKDTNSISLIG